MNPVPHQTQTIHPDNLQPGTYLIDRYQDKEKVLHRVELHDSFVQLFFQGDAEPFACSITELQRRFEIVYPPFRADANLVRLVAEAYRLQHAYLFNPIFATETSLIDPLTDDLYQIRVKQPSWMRHAESNLTETQIQDLSGTIGNLLEIAPELDFKFRIAITAEGEPPSDEVLEQINETLRKVTGSIKV